MYHFLFKFVDQGCQSSKLSHCGMINFYEQLLYTGKIKCRSKWLRDRVWKHCLWVTMGCP